MQYKHAYPYAIYLQLINFGLILGRITIYTMRILSLIRLNALERSTAPSPCPMLARMHIRDYVIHGLASSHIYGHMLITATTFPQLLFALLFLTIGPPGL